MTKFHHPYSRLVDLEIARAKPAATTGLRRTMTAVVIVGVFAIVIAVGIIVTLMAFLYFLGLGEPAVILDGHRHSTPGPGSSATGRTSSAVELSSDFGLLSDRLKSLEREVASLKLQCRICDTLRGKGEQSSEPVWSHLESTTVSNLEVQENAAENTELYRPNTVPVNTNRGSSGGQGSFQEPPTLVTPSTWPKHPAVDMTDKPSSHLSAQQRQPRSKDRRKPRRRSRGETTEDLVGLPVPVPVPVPGLEGADAEPRRDKKKGRSSRNPDQDRSMSESSWGRERDDHGSTCRHCIDNDKIIREDDGDIEIDTFQAHPAFGRAAHIQGNRNGNIRINNEGWVSGTHTWKMADWVDDEDQYFSLNVLGTVTVEESGLYYVYSQVLFYDPNDTVGQSIYINDDPRFTCTKSNISAEAKQSTCYVGGVVRMSAGDTVRIKLSIPNVTIALYADTSYFGLFRVA